MLAGLCSGADMAFWTALEDPRVVGIFQIDPFDYHTPRFYLHRYGPKVDADGWDGFDPLEPRHGLA